MAACPPARLRDPVSRFLKWCRGMLGVSLTWGAMWGTIFAGIFLAVSVVDPGSIGPGEGPLVILRTGAIYGFVSGAVFGVLLSLLERGKRVAELSVLRAAAMGAVAAAPFILLTPADESMLVFLSPIGAGLAAASVAVGRRGALAPPPSKPLLPASPPARPPARWPA